VPSPPITNYSEYRTRSAQNPNFETTGTAARNTLRSTAKNTINISRKKAYGFIVGIAKDNWDNYTLSLGIKIHNESDSGCP